MQEPSDMRDAWVVLAAFNECGAAAPVVESVLLLGCVVVVVDDGSTDGTYGSLLRTGAHLLRHPINLGQGAALQTGLQYALAHGAKFIVTFDADGQHQPEDIAKLLAPLLAGECDAVLGSRFAVGGRALNIPAAKRALLRAAAALTRLSTGLPVTDAHNGLRAFTADAASKLRVTQNRMAHASQILSEIRRLRLRCREVPVTVAYTEYSLAKGQRLANAYNILWDSIMDVFRL